MSSCEKKLNGYVNLKRTVGYQSTIIGEFACYILACLSSCLITEWLQLPHEATSSCHRVSVYCTVSCFAGSVFTSMIQTWILAKMKRGQDKQLPICSYVAEKPCGCLYKLTCCNAKFHSLFKPKLYR